jgi:hypothetical protein
MLIVNDKVSIDELRKMAAGMFGDLVKAVIDVEKGSLALDAELHSDLEALLLANGSSQKDLWGINLYPDVNGDDLVEFDSMINLRPSQGNRSRGVDDGVVREKILRLVNKMVAR